MPGNAQEDDNALADVSMIFMETQSVYDEIEELFEKLSYRLEITLDDILPQNITDRVTERANELRGTLRELNEAMRITTGKLEEAKYIIEEIRTLEYTRREEVLERRQQNERENLQVLNEVLGIPPNHQNGEAQ